jgi:hypothetical protein
VAKCKKSYTGQHLVTELAESKKAE